MKQIPIVILNRDRLDPTKKLVEALHKRGYFNITIIDNQSTYEPLLDWYKTSNLDVFHNDIPETLYDTGTLYRLAVEVKHPKFVDIVKDYYIFTDSDTVPVEELPENFVEHMVEICAKHNLHKVGLGLKIDDLPLDQSPAQKALAAEEQYWNGKIIDNGFELYPAPIDTTFAVYSPNSPALWGRTCYRMGGDYMVRHMPWYYDIANLPEDELYYLQNLPGGRGPCYSWEIKQML